MRRLATAVLTFATLSISSPVFAGTHSAELERMSGSREVDVIITYDASHVAPILGGESRSIKLADLPGGELRRTTVADALRISALAEVAHVTVNHPIMATGTPVYDFMPQSIQPVSQPIFGFQVFGHGISPSGPVGVALIDSGIHLDPSNFDLVNGVSVVYAQSFVTTEGTDDLYGHGTHIAGVIAGSGLNSLLSANDIFGVAPGV